MQDRQVDIVRLGVAHDLVLGRPRANCDLDIEPILILRRNEGREPLARFHLHRLMHFGHPVGAHLGRPSRRQRILDRLQHVQARPERLALPPGECHGSIERLIRPAM